jgi:hypothetical protein
MKNLSCAREGCQVASTSKCLEGFDPPTTCPYLASAPVAGDEAVATETPAFVDLPSGEALSEAQASEVTRQGVTRVVVLAGPSSSGKTTILTSLFEAFLEAPFGNLLFAGSRTLLGFERRCHDARVVSGRLEPHTVHTAVDALDFLHLRLASPSAGLLGPQNLLLSDISGERFRSLRDSSDAVKAMPMLRRADHLSIVIDGEKLTNVGERHGARNDARTLLRSIIESGMLRSDCRIEFVFSKWDHVISNTEQEFVATFIGETKKALEEAAKTFGDPQFFEVAARPRSSRVPFAFGLPTLLRYWVQEPSIPRLKLYMPEVVNDTREPTRFVKSVVENQRLRESYDVRWV